MSSRWPASDAPDPPPYAVWVRDNNQDEEAGGPREAGRFATLAAAEAECRRRVDACLQEFTGPGKTAADVFQLWSMFGEEPYILADEPVAFSAWEYARRRAQQDLHDF